MKGKESHFPGMASGAFLSLVLLAMSLSSHAQTYPFREYTSNDGLPQLETMGVMQDSRGYIWMRTRNGLAQFDGHSFISYFRKDGLPSNIVSRIIEDTDGIIWAVTPNGLARFTGNTFHSYPVPDSLKITHLGFWCLTGKRGVFLLSSISKNIKRIIVFDSGRYYDYSNLYPVLHGDSLAVAAFDNTDTAVYLTGADAALYKFRKGILSAIKKNPLTTIQVKDLIMQNAGRKYTSGDDLSGLYFSNEYSPSFVAWLSDPFSNNPDSILNRLFPGTCKVTWPNGVLIGSMIDRDSTLWMITDTKIFRMVSDAFIEFDKETGLPINPWAIASDPDSGLWIGSINGELKYFDGEHFMKKSGFKGVFKNDPVFFRGSTTLSNGEIWISTNEGVLIREGKKFRKFKPIPDGTQICIIYEDPVDKSILIGASTGLYHIIGDKINFYPEITTPGLGVAEGIARDNYGNYWIAGHLGIILFDGKRFTPFRAAPAPVEMVWGIIKDYNGNIWSAGSDGVFICDPDKPSFTAALPDEVNRPANVIRDLGDHRLLVGRMLDLCVIDLEKYYNDKPDYYTILGRSRGYNGNDCQDNGIVKDAKGNWWLLTNDKLIKFDPEKITVDEKPPLLHIISVERPVNTADWITVLDTSLFYNTGNKLTVKGRRNALRINYTAISTKYPEEITYQFRVTGMDDDWSPRTPERSVILDDLPIGEHTFELYAYNGDGVKSTQPETIGITVRPTLLQTLAARIAGTLLIISLIAFLTFQIRRKRNERRVNIARVQTETYKLQLSSVIKQLDPHFTFNAVTSVGSLIMKGEKEKAYNYFIKLSGLLRSVLTDSAVLLKTINEEVEFVARYCELQKLRYGNRFDYTIKVAPDVDLNTLVPKMILQSFVENAIVHGIENKKGKGVIEIEVRTAKNGNEWVVRDNGIGRKAASELHTHGAGLSIKNITTAMEMLNRVNHEKATLTYTDLYDNDQPSGTEVRGFLPLNYEFDFSINKPPRTKHKRHE